MKSAEKSRKNSVVLLYRKIYTICNYGNFLIQYSGKSLKTKENYNGY